MKKMMKAMKEEEEMSEDEIKRQMEQTEIYKYQRELKRLGEA